MSGSESALFAGYLLIMEDNMVERQDFIDRYKKRVIEKACVSEEMATEMAEEAFEEFGQEDTPEECVDSELSYWGD